MPSGNGGTGRSGFGLCNYRRWFGKFEAEPAARKPPIGPEKRGEGWGGFPPGLQGR